MVDTRKGAGGAIRHLVKEETALPEAGAEVTASIDWDRRYRHMRMHTAMHLVGSLIPFGVTGGNISADKSRLLETFGTILYSPRTMLASPHARLVALSEEHGWIDVPGGAIHDVGDPVFVVQGHPVRHPPAAIMSDQKKPLMAQGTHQVHHILCHRTLGVERMGWVLAGRVGAGFVRCPIAPQIRADHLKALRQ